MAQILKTTEAEDGHYHLLYLGDDGTASSSLDDNHAHLLEVDQQTGQPRLSFGLDGHTHEVLPFEPEAKKEKSEDDAQTVSDVLTLFTTWLEAEEESRNCANEADKAHQGDQWDGGEKSLLESQGRACLTINSIQRHIDELIGYQTQNRTDLKFLPMEGSDQRVSDILNEVSKHITERCFFEREETEAFSDQVIAGRGILELRVDFSEDLEGDIKIEQIPWQDVVFAPHLKHDLSDCEGLVKHRKLSRAKLKQLFPEVADEVAAGLDEAFGLHSSDPHLTRSVGQYVQSDNWKLAATFNVGGVELLDIAKKDIRILECWRRYYKRVNVIVNPLDDFYLNAENWKAKDVKKAKTIPGIAVIERGVAKMRITKVAGGTLLSDEFPADLPVNDFFVVPVYASKRRDFWWGKVWPVLDSQMEINKRRSQAIDIGNRMASYGWFIDDGMFHQPRDFEDFKKKASTPGFVVKVNDVSKVPVRVEGSNFPTEIVRMIEMSDGEMAASMNIRVDPSGANQSADHFKQMIQQRLRGNNFLFDNLAFAKKKLGKLLVGLIQRYYSAERIYRILVAQGQRKEVQLGGQPLERFSKEEIINMLSTTDLSRYDVIVSESMHSPTTRMANFMFLSELAKNSGIPIPPEALIELMDLPDEMKAKIIQGIQAQQQAQGQAEQAKMKMEINKTLIAQGIMPPEVQRVLQEQQQPQQQPPGQQGPPQAPPGLQM